jgi:hypothetical protein
LLATVRTQLLHKGGAVKGRKPDTPWQKIVKLAHLVDVKFLGTAQVVNFAGTILTRQLTEVEEAEWNFKEVHI